LSATELRSAIAIPTTTVIRRSLRNGCPEFVDDIPSPYPSRLAEHETMGSITPRGIPPVASKLMATFKTNHGDIVVELFPNHAPKTVENFVGLAEGTKEWIDPETGQVATKPLYDNLVFHRIIPDFMLQGGDPLGSGMGGPGYQFEDEFHPDLQFDRPYLLAMANSGPGTNGSQFFITVIPTAWLNRKHTIFGEVTDEASRKVVDEIAKVPTGRMDRPVEPVVINSVEVTED